MEDTKSTSETNKKKKDINHSHKSKTIISRPNCDINDVNTEKVTDTDQSPSFFQTVENYYIIMMAKVVKRYKWLKD